MRKFEYYEPHSLPEAADLLAELGESAKVLAGGTDLIVQMRDGIVNPQHVINIKKVPELAKIAATKDGVEIGAAVSMFNAEKALANNCGYFVLCEAMHSVASCQIRNRATLAGNVCNASPAGDTIPALFVLDAQVVIYGPRGERKSLIKDFFVGPRRTTLTRGEFVTGIILPSPSSEFHGTYLKKSRRPSVDLATVGVAVCFDGNHAKIALGAVAPTVVRAEQAEELIKQEGLTHVSAAKAGRLAVEAASPISDLRGSREYRLRLVETLTERALRKLLSGGGQ